MSNLKAPESEIIDEASYLKSDHLPSIDDKTRNESLVISHEVEVKTEIPILPLNSQ